MKKLLSLTLLLCCSLLVMVACGPGGRVAELYKPAPDFSLVDRQGKTWTLSELKGQVVFVNFWATWCPPCREEMPSMQKLHEMLPKDKFKMLAILNNDDPALADSFAAKLGLTMPILNDQANKVGPRYGLTGMPETFIINKQGVLMEKFIGAAQWDSPAYIQMLMKYINQ
jgi:peroxiredoxin